MEDHFIELDFTIPMCKESQGIAMDAIAIVEKADVQWEVLYDEENENYGKPTFENLFSDIECDDEQVRALALAFAQKSFAVIPDEGVEVTSPLTQLFVRKCDDGLHVTNDGWPYLDMITVLIECCQEHLDTQGAGFTWDESSTRGHNESKGIWVEPGEEPVSTTLDEWVEQKKKSSARAAAAPSPPELEMGL